MWSQYNCANRVATTLKDRQRCFWCLRMPCSAKGLFCSQSYLSCFGIALFLWGGEHTDLTVAKTTIYQYSLEISAEDAATLIIIKKTNACNSRCYCNKGKQAEQKKSLSSKQASNAFQALYRFGSTDAKISSAVFLLLVRSRKTTLNAI